jgi:murein DD-endopeptidase MepM/ murein hydrolase activator NlpD
MPQGKPLVTVADGKVLWSGTRDVSSAGCKYSDPKQKEIYIEHQVGSNKYAERFVTIYYHLDKFVNASGGQTDTPLAAGTLLGRGQTFGVVGSTGVVREGPTSTSVSSVSRT